MTPAADGSLRVGVLGLNAWILAVALPAALGGPRSVLGAALPVLVPPAVLAAGVALLARDRGGRGATWTLLAAYPTALAWSVLRLEGVLEEPPTAGAGWLVALLALGAFLVVAASRTGAPGHLHPTRPRPLDEADLPDEPAGRRRLRAALIGVTLVGAAILALLPAVFPDPEAFERAWDEDGRREAQVLVAVVGVALGTAVLTLFLGSALRAPRAKRPRPAELRRSLAVALTLAALGAAAWLAFGRGLG